MSTTIKDNNDNNNVTPDDPKIMPNNFLQWQPFADNCAVSFLNLPPPPLPFDKRASQLVSFPLVPPGFIRPPVNAAGIF